MSVKKLYMKWSKREKDYVISYPSSSSGWAMHDLIRSEGFKGFEKDMKEMGFDLTTLKISIQKRSDNE